MMNEVSIIINGVRYDAFPAEEPRSCVGCELKPICSLHCFSQVCLYEGDDTIFKKSDKKFER